MIIGLIGLKNSGKDSLVKLLEKNNPDVKVVNLKFARGIKFLLENYFNIPSLVYENAEMKEKKVRRLKKSPRDLMILLGMFFRQIDKDCWVNYIDNYLKNIQDNYLEREEDKKIVYIFTDVRFKNEVDYLIRKKAILIDVERKDLYAKEKKLIKLLGHNQITKFLIKLFFDKSITVESEWQYFKNKKRVDYNLDNTNLEIGYKSLESIFDFKSK